MSEVPDNFPLAITVGESQKTASVSDIPVVREDFGTVQLHDPNLANTLKNVKVIDRVQEKPDHNPWYTPYFVVSHDLLYCITWLCHTVSRSNPSHIHIQHSKVIEK